jgi:CheY-like chemotaxis protein
MAPVVHSLFSLTTMATVLLVEDNVDVREMMATALELDGHCVRTAANGWEALRLLESGVHPCVILLDLMMPVMDGWAFGAELENKPALAAIPVIVVSAVGGDLLNRVRAAAYVSKPVDIDRLLEIVCEKCP